FVVSYSYAVYAVSENCIGCLRGMGKSVFPTALNAFFICVPRIIWVMLVLPLVPGADLAFIYSCYVITYVLSGLAQVGCYLYYTRKEKKQMQMQAASEAEPFSV
ncbi:MAG: hypothetical protein IKC69_06720, partial [Clostridia bacterium]|nr:hypothetical protein [Clostridia bacterium]